MSLPAGLLNILVHPVYKTPLRYDATNGELTDINRKDHFIVKERVPVLLTQPIDISLRTTERHQQAGTEFQYKEHYQKDASAYDYTEESQNPIEREEVNRLRQNILSEILPGEWILDVGCGGAWLAKELVPKGRQVISMDISDINPIKALKEVPAPNHYGLVADVFELPIKPNSIDCIVASEIIEHVPDPKKFIAALYEVLKPQGKLIITTPYNELIRTSLCIHCNRLTPHNAHLHSFTEQTMKQYLPPDTERVTMKVLNCKLLVKAGIQKMLSFLPLGVYSVIDQFGIEITKRKAYRLMVIIEK